MPTYNKLVRDRIPEIITSRGLTPNSRKLDTEEYRIELRKKLQEEVQEYLSAANDKESVEELADVLEVLHGLVEIHGSSVQELEQVRAHKAAERGGFRDRCFLIDVPDA
ncbi:putative house-cleaning noncanonical NTP pyrophosphatase (MazG superfamily) [Paenibacillus mucilaginosus]|uniref:nucleoside triphosphate pyrophosphohydrolase n=1 Tax=Paenibacillus mucilaginosus TaxID=61624 RepID=UPI003D236DB6